MRASRNILAIAASVLVFLGAGCGSDSGSGPPPPGPPVPNDAPVFGTPVTEALHNQPYAYSVQVTDADGDPLTIRAPRIPVWMSFDAGAHILSGVPGWENVGSHDVRVTASDGKAPQTQEFTVVVEKGDVLCGQDFGDPAASAYILPYRPGSTFTVSEGNCAADTTSAHHLRFGYDFDLAAGDTARAVRSGRVVVQSGTGSGSSEAPPQVLLVQHGDGTVMEYANLDPGLQLQVGDLVERGQAVGAVGAGSAAGLHLGLYRGTDDLSRKGSLPLTFRNAEGSLDDNRGLRTGSSYEATRYLEVGRADRVDPIDLANGGDASDLVVSFRGAANETGVAEYRVVVNKALGGVELTAATAMDLPAERYHSVEPAGGETKVQLRSDLLDAQGDPVIEGVAYRAQVLTVPVDPASTIPALSPRSPTVTLAVTDLVITLTDVIQAGSGGMEVDAEGNIYAADFGASLQSPPGTRVFKITPEGEVELWATGLVGASGNAFDSQGHLMQSNIGANRISRIAPDGPVSTFTTQGVNNPVGIAIDGGDTLYVANCGNNTISKIHPDRTWSTLASGSSFNCPNGIALADDGNLYVANFGDGRVIRVTPGGATSTLATLPGGNNGHVTWANGLLYVVARSANMLYSVTLDGALTRIAGTGQRGLRDGPATEAHLSLTNDVAVSPDGRILYFNDVVNLTGTQVISPVVIRMLILEGGN